MTSEYPIDEAATARAVIDADGRVTEWGEGARRLLGWAADEVVGRLAARLVQGRAPTLRGSRWDGTLTLRHRDGRTVSVWLLAHQRPGPGGGAGDWLVVTPLEGARARPDDDPLDRAELTQSPCAVAIYDERLRLHRMNDALAAVLKLPEERIRGLRVTELSGRLQSEEIEQQLHRVLTTGRVHDFYTSVPVGEDGRSSAWLGRMAPISDAAGRVCGVCVAVHDLTEQHLARERLRLVNEASVRVGSTLDVTRTAQELADVCVPGLADFCSVDLLDPREPTGEPAAGPLTAPITLRRAAHQSISPGPEAVVQPGRPDVYPAGSPQADSLLAGRTIIADMSSEALAQWLSWDRARREQVRKYGIHSTMSVPIRARGTTLGVAVLTRFRRPAPFTPDDRMLAEEITARAAVCMDNARRYSRERETALALQRSLLPQSLPSTAAVQACSRYLPAARAGVGGDWFDVIPLSGTRVAMVVGDVVGHGIQASATMGRLRTAVRTLADIDLAPDELLTHLDDLVLRLSDEAGADGSSGEVGATCLYAVYDPVSRCCSLARAGHPSPLMVRPGGLVEEVELPTGPPLGLGGLPFEAAELYLPEGTVLSFFTNGLTESRARDAGGRHELLREALSQSSASLDETCDRILHLMLPTGGVGDDVALLLARTQGLPASQVATWDIPADPALVAPVRRQVVDQLGTWGLEEASFTTELVVSELVTNAIRYGSHPIRLRLIHDAATLICEVSDTSHTAPHLRRAKIWDEGGRGLLLVAQLTQRWGSRHTPEGKTIWAELAMVEAE
ncbi:SpoIIE family protein phosphatase [Streptomyces sp. TRM70350]|uniref:SpoIIE family protein phosphatase n=1 Tax=Streptomyces sp. TRM70350 TaxID=2856165 RepID=UPI001C436CF9|nr:SpoIIE family protein phosphatase [Streptomyces sp. TRM70350]MBV7694606.1 SpoIIE family protein phosphatase [Streptomyces sp. TRM70350]